MLNLRAYMMSIGEYIYELILAAFEENKSCREKELMGKVLKLIFIVASVCAMSNGIE